MAAKVERPFEADAWGKMRSRSCAEAGHGVPWTIINRKIIRFMTKRFPPAAYKRCSGGNTRKLLRVLADSHPDALSETARKLIAGE